MNKQVQTFSMGFSIAIIALTVIGLSVVALLSTWNATNATPIPYVVVDIINNGKIELPECDSPQMTIVRNIVTDQIVYKCGAQGKVSEIITLYE